MNTILRGVVKPLDLIHGKINMTHGSGGRASAQLIDELFKHYFSNDLLDCGDDNAVFAVEPGKLVVSTDSHVISPLIFPGGDIGTLAVHGTLNDVAVAGAKPLYLTAAFILEEGLPLSVLNNVVQSMAFAAARAGVKIVTGDTKVVEKGKGDGLFITTTGVGVVTTELDIKGRGAKPGDKVIVSGTIGDHGVAIMASRENLEFETEIKSDSANLYPLIEAMLATDAEIHCLRDPTRGGVATTLNELARQSQVGINIHESEIPIKPGVSAACELLGLDPLYIANEGKLLVICASDDAEKLLAVMRSQPLGTDAAIIGEVCDDQVGFVHMQTHFGGSRVVDWLAGDPLPRIC